RTRSRRSRYKAAAFRTAWRNMLATGSKPKKRSRLALPRQRGARATSNGSALRSKSKASEQQQQETGKARAGVSADGSTTAVNGAASDSAGSVAVPPLATASSACGLPSPPTTAGAVGRASAPAATTREEPPSRARALYHVPKSEGGSGCGDALVTTDENSKCTARQPGSSPSKGPEQAGRETYSQEERGGARRPPLRAVPLNMRSEEKSTAAAAAGAAKQDFCAATAAAATIAAAASEVTRLLDSLTKNKDGCDGENGELPGEAVRRETPPAAIGPSSSGGINDDQPSVYNGRASGAQSDLQQQQQPRSRKGGPLGDTMPSAASLNQPILQSSQTPTTPPGKRGATTTHNGVDGTPSHPAVAMTAKVDEREVVEESANSVGRGGSGGRAAAERRPTPPSSAAGEPCSGKRERCPVCGSAVWGLSVRARQVHINSCLDGMAAGSST
ncbi:unnamed protein product, partial [Ectocarpus sp. 13 AM-2016]